MMRNIEIKMAVATNPKEMAFMDEPRLFHGPSLLTSPAASDIIGVGGFVVLLLLL